ncbi:MAG: ABC-2 family transporter protein [Ilumatobacteraceae bacterium]
MTAATTAPTAPPAPAETSGWRSYVRLYRTLGRHGVQVNMQYRAANYMSMIGMAVEPVVYLVVWSTIAEQSGGTVGGYTPATFAAYYIAWTLVRNMNIALTPNAWEERIREGTMSFHLVRPMHPVHYDIGYFAGWKIVVIGLWIPLAAVLSLIFRPALHTNVEQCVVFFVAIWGAFVLRTLLLWSLGMITFWTTRAMAVSEVYFYSELLLSGRVLPVSLLPSWAQTIGNLLPFRWSFGYPITALVGPISRAQLYLGLLAQLAWIVFAALLVKVIWKRAVKHFTAVSG